MTTQSPIIVALDFPAAEPALALTAQLDPSQCRLKVGKELFTAAGPGLLRALHDRGFEVFLDLKFHDIPSTVAAAVRSAADLGVWMLNVHASGGRRMLEAAAEAAARQSTPPLLIAVTVLTSMDSGDYAELGYADTLEDRVTRLACLSQDCGLGGVVCSAREARALRACCGPEFALVTPGIRPPGSSPGDQSRVVTPVDAVANGANYLVIGRPITQATHPQEALRSINDSLR